eukprot:m51a1_g2625 hypothetical protein (562) ;mRNA; f:551062-553036
MDATMDEPAAASHKRDHSPPPAAPLSSSDDAASAADPSPARQQRRAGRRRKRRNQRRRPRSSDAPASRPSEDPISTPPPAAPQAAAPGGGGDAAVAAARAAGDAEALRVAERDARERDRRRGEIMREQRSLVKANNVRPDGSGVPPDLRPHAPRVVTQEWMAQPRNWAASASSADGAGGSPAVPSSLVVDERGSNALLFSFGSAPALSPFHLPADERGSNAPLFSFGSAPALSPFVRRPPDRAQPLPAAEVASSEARRRAGRRRKRRNQRRRPRSSDAPASRPSEDPISTPPPAAPQAAAPGGGGDAAVAAARAAGDAEALRVAERDARERDRRRGEIMREQRSLVKANNVRPDGSGVPPDLRPHAPRVVTQEWMAQPRNWAASASSADGAGGSPAVPSSLVVDERGSNALLFSFGSAPALSPFHLPADERGSNAPLFSFGSAPALSPFVRRPPDRAQPLPAAEVASSEARGHDAAQTNSATVAREEEARTGSSREMARLLASRVFRGQRGRDLLAKLVEHIESEDGFNRDAMATDADDNVPGGIPDGCFRIAELLSGHSR